MCPFGVVSVYGDGVCVGDVHRSRCVASCRVVVECVTASRWVGVTCVVSYAVSP